MTLLKNKYFIGTVAIIVLLLYFFLDARKGFFPPCPFYVITDLYCPGCGSQRALSALLHGDLAEAIQDNILLVVSIPILLWNAAVQWRKDKQYFALLYKPVFVKAVLVVVIGFWVLRNLPFFPMSLLAPLKV
ncbi:MAG TPA: DUF2752 domain-containing protein [Chitinophagaceae bacterium]